MPGLAALEFTGDLVQIRKEGADEGEEFFAPGSEREGAALEKSHAKKFLELGDLGADGGLLICHRGCYARRA